MKTATLTHGDSLLICVQNIEWWCVQPSSSLLCQYFEPCFSLQWSGTSHSHADCIFHSYDTKFEDDILQVIADRYFDSVTSAWRCLTWFWYRVSHMQLTSTCKGRTSLAIIRTCTSCAPCAPHMISVINNVQSISYVYRLCHCLPYVGIFLMGGIFRHSHCTWRIMVNREHLNALHCIMAEANMNQWWTNLMQMRWCFHFLVAHRYSC